MVRCGSHKVPKKLASLVATTAEMALASLAPSSLKAYNKVVVEFKEFVLGLDFRLFDFPVSPFVVAIFMSSLYRKGVASSTIASKLSALSFWHRMYYMDDPTSHFMVRRVLSGMRKLRPGGSLRPPLTFSDL